jgi:thioredoxin-like negative regulator of GroEL
MEKLTYNNFAEAIKNSTNKVVVRFYADWCPDCRRTEQGSEEIAINYRDKCGFYRVDIEDQPKLAERYNVKGYPSFLVFEAGKEIDRLYSRDAKTKEQILEFIKQQAE